MTDATAPEGGALPEAGASQHSAASNCRHTAGDCPLWRRDSPQKEGKGDQEEGDCPRVQRCSVGDCPWDGGGLSLGMEDFHAAGPSDLL